MVTHTGVGRYGAGLPQYPPTYWPVRQGRVDAPSTQEILDRITCAVGDALGVPTVCASLVDARRRLLASSYGLPISSALLL